MNKTPPVPTKIKKDNNRARINPSYDKNLSPEIRLYDFLGKYYINLNGVVPNNIPEITEPHKKEIVDFVLKIIADQKEDVMKVLNKCWQELRDSCSSGDEYILARYIEIIKKL